MPKKNTQAWVPGNGTIRLPITNTRTPYLAAPGFVVNGAQVMDVSSQLFQPAEADEYFPANEN